MLHNSAVVNRPLSEHRMLALRSIFCHLFAHESVSSIGFHGRVPMPRGNCFLISQ